MALSRQDKEQLLKEWDVRQSKKSLFYFAKNVLGYDLHEVPHREICDFMQDEAKPFKLILLPRGSYKTSIISQAYPIWRIISEPNVRILLDSEVLLNSQNNLNVVSNHLKENKKFRAIFGDYASRRWTMDSITVGKRTNLSLRDPTVGTASVETIQIGTHWDVIIVDDIHSEKNVRSKILLEEAYEHFRLLFGLLEPYGTIIVVGTRWNDLDIYGRIIENHKDFKTMVRAAVDSKGNFYFPARLTEDFLRQQKTQLGVELFNAQYQNDPLPASESARFHKAWFRYDEKRVGSIQRIFVTLDAAIPTDTSNKNSDNCAIVAGGLDGSNNLIIADYDFGKWEPYETIKRLFKMVEKYETQVIYGGGIGLETNAFQKMFRFEFDRECKKRGKYYKVHELRPQRSKEERILALQPLYESGSCYHQYWMQGGQLEEELLWFPKGRRDDLIDAAAALLELVRPLGVHTPLSSLSKEDLRRKIDDEYEKLNRLPLVKKTSRWSFDEIADGYFDI